MEQKIYKGHSEYNYKDFIPKIRTASVALSRRSSIDIDEFVSLGGLIWSECIHSHDVAKSSFNTHFWWQFRYYSRNFIRDSHNVTRGGRVIKVEIDAVDEGIRVYDFSTYFSIDNTSIKEDFYLLSDNSKFILNELANYKECKNKSTFENKKKLSKFMFKLKKKVGNGYKDSIKEICELIPGSRPAKNETTFPLTGILRG